MLITALLLLGISQPPSQSSEGEAARVLALLRPSEQDLQIDRSRGEERPGRVLELLDRYSQLMGWRLSLPTEEDELQAKLVPTGLLKDLRAPAGRVHLLAQSIVHACGFDMRFGPPQQPPMLIVESEFKIGPSEGLGAGIPVREDSLAAWDEFPAFVVSVELALPVVDLSRVRRDLLRLPNAANRVRLEEMTPGSLRVSGTVPWVRFVTDTLRNGPRLAQSLESAETEAKARGARTDSAVRVSAGFPPGERNLVLMSDEPPPDILQVLGAFAEWSRRPMLRRPEAFSRMETLTRGAEVPGSVPSLEVYGYISGVLADAHLTLDPYPRIQPVLWVTGTDLETGHAFPHPECILAIRLDELPSVSHLRATRFQTFVRLPKDDRPGSSGLEKLESQDAGNPFWITPLTDPELLSIIGTPRGISLAIEALRVAIAPQPPR